MLPFPSQGESLDPGLKPRSPTLQANSLPSEPPGKLFYCWAVFYRVARPQFVHSLVEGHLDHIRFWQICMKLLYTKCNRFLSLLWGGFALLRFWCLFVNSQSSVRHGTNASSGVARSVNYMIREKKSLVISLIWNLQLVNPSCQYVLHDIFPFDFGSLKKISLTVWSS